KTFDFHWQGEIRLLQAPFNKTLATTSTVLTLPLVARAGLFGEPIRSLSNCPPAIPPIGFATAFREDFRRSGVAGRPCKFKALLTEYQRGRNQVHQNIAGLIRQSGVPNCGPHEAAS